MKNEIPFLEYVPQATDSELARYRKRYIGRTDALSVQHARGVRNEIARRRRVAMQSAARARADAIAMSESLTVS